VDLRSKPLVFDETTARVRTPCGNVFVILGRDDDGPLDMRLVFGKAGGCVATWAEVVSRLVSLMLRAGFTKQEIGYEFRGLACQRGDNERGGEQASCLHQIAEVLDRDGQNPDS